MDNAEIGKLRMAMTLTEAVEEAGGRIPAHVLLAMSVTDLIEALGPNGVIFVCNKEYATTQPEVKPPEVKPPEVKRCCATCSQGVNCNMGQCGAPDYKNWEPKKEDQ